MDSSISARLDARLAARLAEKKARLDSLRPLPPAVLQRLAADMRVLLTYHSNAIEGNTLSLYETKMVIEEGVTISSQPLRYYLEARNHAEALDQVRALAERHAPITTETVLLMHRLMMNDVLPDAGQWRAGYVHIRGASYMPPHPREVAQLMADWVAWLDGDGRAHPPVLRVALAHVVFEASHPFSDGNGRVGRLLMNLMLMREGYPPALLPQEWRTGYMHGLHLAQTTGNHTPICNLVGRAVELALDRYLESIAASDAIPLPLSELAERTGYRAEHLGWLVRKGRLPAVKRGRRWFATVAAVERYRAEVAGQAIPRGRPPKGELSGARSTSPGRAK